MSFADDLIAYQGNAWPAMVADLAQDLGVSARSLSAIGIGWIPDRACWAFPERDAEGKVVGLALRSVDGKKFMVKGSERGLTYALSPDFDPNGEAYVPGSQNWTRSSEEFACPICERSGDGCLLSAENPVDPRAVICVRTAEGARQPLGESGYLHILKATGDINTSQPLAMSSLPVIVVEGQSDVATGLGLGFETVGKPSSAGGLSMLAELLCGREVVVLGENDAGAGRAGMEKTFEVLKPKCKSVVKLMPPEGIKDLRVWFRSGLTAAKLEDAIQNGSMASSTNLLESTAPLDVAARWLQERHWMNGLPTIRVYAGYWYQFDKTRYSRVDEKTYVRGDLYSFLKDKTHKKFTSKGELVIEPYEANLSRVNNIMDALTMTCPVYEDAPCWLDDEPHPEIRDIVGFNNGLLLLPTQRLIPATPRFFSMTAMPYDWNAEATCERWLQFLREIFPNDPEKILLLQEWFGYNMVSDTAQEKLMFFVGRPGAGKGTVLEALRAVLGSNQVASTSFDTLISDFGLQPLLGKLAAIMPDAHITRRGDPAKALQILKEISGRDGVGVNRKNKEFLSDHKLSCRFTISVNAMPDLPDHERSLDRRLLLLHFGECFTGREDTGLKDRLTEEAPGIAVWALSGLARLRAQGFTSPRSSGPVIEEFRKQSSPVSEFADEHCIFGPHTIPSAMLYDAFVHWCKDQGSVAGTQTRFTQRFCLLYPGCRTDRLMFNNSQTRCFVGVKLSDAAVERYLVGRR
jgi:P4 family phage/plasmid primase-like protien